MTTSYVDWDEAALRDAAALAVDHAVRMGADGATASARASGGVRIVVRDRVAETALRDNHQSLGLTVFRGGRSGSASTVALDEGSVRHAAGEAFAIAGHVAADPMAGLADPDALAWTGPVPPTFAPSGRDAANLLELALEMEAVTLAHGAPDGIDLRISEAGVASSDTVMALATSAGFCRSASSSNHGRWAMVLAQRGGTSMQDFHETGSRRFDSLDDPAIVAARAIGRATGRIGARGLSSRSAPALFDARVAAAIVRDLVGALSGGPQYRGASFLHDTLGTQVLAAHVDLAEDPFEPFGMVSGGFDGEGVAGTARRVIEGGTVQGYFLATAAGRRLGMRSTGNANGPWNLSLTSRVSGGDAAALRTAMHTGLIVTQLLGGATDPVSGNWTRAVEGFWVENGEIVHPVGDITLGGTMRDMLAGIVAIGDDVERSGGIRSGSILIDAMRIGGSA